MKWLVIAALGWAVLIWPAAGANRFRALEQELKSSPELHAEVIESGKVVWQKGRVTAPAPEEPAFSQDYEGLRLLWSYTESGLSLQVPSKRLRLVVSGNLKPMIEAARLEDGNIARSSIALAFLGGNPRDELIDRALNALYQGDKAASAALAHEALDKFPEIETTPDVTLLYLFAQLGLRETEASATAVIAAHPSLPTAWFYYGQFLENSKRYREAAACYEQITMHEPPFHNWTVQAAKRELKYLKTY